MARQQAAVDAFPYIYAVLEFVCEYCVSCMYVGVYEKAASVSLVNCVQSDFL